MSIEIRWLGTACFEIRSSNGESVIIDPYIDESITAPISSDEIERADLICISHGHFDHILDVGKIANRLGSTVICSHKVSSIVERHFSVPERQIQRVTSGEVIKRGSIRIEVVKAIHIDNRLYYAEQLGIEPPDGTTTEEMVKRVFSQIEDPELRNRLISHLGKYPAGEQLNFIFQFPGNLRLYFFGSIPDPVLFPLVEASKAQVLILQLLTRREEGAVEVALHSGASIVIPSHHDPFYPGQKAPDVEKVRSLLEKYPDIHFVETEAGKWYKIEISVKE